jgi:hypothetical protein
MHRWRSLLVVVLVVSGVVVGTQAAGAAAPTSGAKAYTCDGSGGGIVPPGTYRSVNITGVCYVPAGAVTILDNLSIAPGALLDAAATLGDPVASHILPGTVVVDGNVTVGVGAVLALGCSPAGGCHGVTYDRIGGNLNAVGAQAVLVQAVAIGGNATVLGGGGGVVGGPGSNGCFSPKAKIPAPWSRDPQLIAPPNGSPQYTDFEDSTIGGNFKVIGVQSCYVASFRDVVGGNVTFSGNATSDSDGSELATNLVGGNLICQGNAPAVQYGDSGATSNIVSGRAAGECGFNVVLPNGTTNEHISVPASRLGTDAGTHRQVSSNTMSLGTTVAGDQLTESMNTVDLQGSGLVGKSQPEMEVATVHPDGSGSFLAEDPCSCSFHGHQGSVTVEAYGSASASGVVTGRFLIVSGGSANLGLATLAGWGTFTSVGQRPGTVALVEHLAMTPTSSVAAAAAPIADGAWGALARR